ncbi:transmembrane and TPR repeat-containing protein CG4050-like [Limulus polyphemus]|uniref:dolichyl-phosphate-mannose--protein mannosyltransferase n=1 Tax=Limulus polyphemus TaxID=6850 RepID=A0ABM1SYT9_LIMPO|nr:transmembrane and TPR repeat-containing protein CG4050-like [Limulus polyphemus]
MEKIPLKVRPLIVVSLAVVVYYNSLGGELVFDDVAAIQDNRDVRPHNPLYNLFVNDFWGTPIHKEQSHKSYRPLCVLSFRLNYAVHEVQPFGYHVVNVLLHAVVCFLYFRTCLLFLSSLASFVAALIFSVHPVHTEAVAGIVGRAELLSAIFFLSALMYYVKNRHSSHGTASCFFYGQDLWSCGVTLVLATLGTLCKEQCFTVLAVCCLLEVLKLRVTSSRSTRTHTSLPWQRGTLLRSGLLMTGAALIGGFRLKLMSSQLPQFNRFDNPAAVSPTPTRQLTYNYLLSLNAWLLLYPCDLCCDWTMGSIPLVKTIYDFRNLATLVLYVFIVVIFWWTSGAEEKQLSIFMVSFIVSTLLPSLKTVANLGLFLLLSTHIIKTVHRNREWENEQRLFSSGLKVNPLNAKLDNNMGKVLEAQQRHEEALNYYNQAIKMQPNDVRGFLNSGRVLTFLRRYQEAEDIYLKAKAMLPQAENPAETETHVTPSHLQVFLGLASLLSRNTSRLEEADALYREAIRLRSDYTAAYLNRGDVLLKLNRSKEAEDMYIRALQFDADNPNLYYNLGVVLMDQGRSEEALTFFSRALELEPQHKQALLNSAMLLQDRNMQKTKEEASKSWWQARLDRTVGATAQGPGRMKPGYAVNQQSIFRFHKATDGVTQTEDVYFSLGMLALENGNSETAERWFRKAVEIKPSDRSALFNLALLLTEENRHSEALEVLQQLLQHHATHVKGLLLLGDIYVTQLENLDGAETCYQKILEVDPQNVQGLHNLCVVYLHRGHLKQTEECFLKALNLAPRAEYIKHHLQLVRSQMLKQNQPMGVTQKNLRHLKFSGSIR